MTATAIDSPVCHECKPVCLTTPVHRSAFYLEDCDQPLFAWLHQHSQCVSVDHGVIICSPIGYEQLHSHRSLRRLADTLAAQRIPTLRFDWHGTGDSPGVDQDPDLYRTWLNNIKSAVQWMRTKLGCRRISLIGLRMGGSLAALATLESEINNLVLWSPVIKGRTYVREMKALSLTAEAPAGRLSSNPDDIEAAGFVLSSETAADLSKMDLSQVQPRCDRVLVISRADLSDDDRLSQQWATRGVRVQQISTFGYAEMMAIPHRSRIPFAAIDEMSEWLTNEISADAQELATIDCAIHASSTFMSTATVHSNGDPSHEVIRESTFTVDANPELFGIVSEPKQPVDADLPTIVLLTAGAAHRIGPNRLYTFIARQLAAVGFRCLRIDLGGMGDSAHEFNDCDVDTYPATAFRDINRTLTQIEHDLGARRIVLMGLCSGAYAAFQSAARINNPALVESVLINPLTFFWTEGMSIDDSPTKHLRTFHYYKSVALDPKKWLKLLSGKSKVGIKGAATMVARQLKLLKQPSKATNSIRRTDERNHSLTHPEKEDLPGDLQRIANAGRTLAMFFSSTDPGLEILNYHASRKARQLRSKGQLKITAIDGADHTFTLQSARTDLIKAISVHLRNRFSLKDR